jgi:hypothetical protein
MDTGRNRPSLQASRDVDGDRRGYRHQAVADICSLEKGYGVEYRFGTPGLSSGKRPEADPETLRGPA